MKLSLAEKQDYMLAMNEAVKSVGYDVLNYKGAIEDTGTYKGQEESTIDVIAYSSMQRAIENALAKRKLIFKGKFLFEHRELQDTRNGSGDFRIDEIDGTTNAKRALASKLIYRPNSAICIALCENESMGSILVGSVYDINQNSIFSGLRVEDDYMAFHDERLLNKSDFVEMKGDSKNRVIVAGYSNPYRMKKAQLEEALLENGLIPYEGCRSSTLDIINIIRNQFDGYIDLRTLWGPEGARLQPYDVAAVIPVALGVGLSVSDNENNSLDKYTKELPIVVARQKIKDKIIGVTSKV